MKKAHDVNKFPTKIDQLHYLVGYLKDIKDNGLNRVEILEDINHPDRVIVSFYNDKGKYLAFYTDEAII